MERMVQIPAVKAGAIGMTNGADVSNVDLLASITQDFPDCYL